MRIKKAGIFIIAAAITCTTPAVPAMAADTSESVQEIISDNEIDSLVSDPDKVVDIIMYVKNEAAKQDISDDHNRSYPTAKVIYCMDKPSIARIILTEDFFIISPSTNTLYPAQSTYNHLPHRLSFASNTAPVRSDWLLPSYYTFHHEHIIKSPVQKSTPIRHPAYTAISLPH